MNEGDRQIAEPGEHPKEFQLESEHCFLVVLTLNSFSTVLVERNLPMSRWCHTSYPIIRILQSIVKTFLPGFGNGWLKYCANGKFCGGQRKILRLILKT